MSPLGRAPRAVLAAGAFAAFAGAFAAAPLDASGAAGAPSGPAAAVGGMTPPPPDDGPIVARRDPFDGDVHAQRPPPPVEPEPARIPAALGPLPPNAGALGTPFAGDAAGARVTAVVTGTQPVALVEEHGVTRIVGLGDPLAGDTVAAITAAGVLLGGGRVLPIDAHPPSATSPLGGRLP